MGGGDLATPICRLRYSRDEVYALKETSSSIELPINPVPLKHSRQIRKKSQSGEADCNASSENGHSTVDAPGAARRVRLWHPPSGRGHSHFQQPHYQRPRHPSGPHGDSNETDGSATFRPVSSDLRRGAQGDWSKGCAGWRQRSYSGSEDLGVVVGPSYPRGRGTTMDGDFPGFRGRGFGRHPPSHRGPRAFFSGPNRPASFVHASDLPNHATEAFWQDDEWKSLNLENDLTKPEDQTKAQDRRERDPTSGQLVKASNGSEASMAKRLTKAVRHPRQHTQSCSIDPPPGFEFPFPASLHNDDVPECPEEVTEEVRADALWYYIDSAGQTQGPFGNDQMTQWLSKGYLPLHIEVRRECDECFLPLLTHLAMAGRIPFWRGYSQVPITRSNLASILAVPGSPMPSPLWTPSSLKPPISSSGLIPTTECVPITSNITPDKPSSDLLVEQGEHVASSLTHISMGAMPIPCDSPVDQSPDSSSALPVDNSEILRLCTEAQALAVHAAKVEAERQELAEKLNAISSTAARLLATQSNQPSPPSPMTTYTLTSTVSSVNPPPGWTSEVEMPVLGPDQTDRDDKVTVEIREPESGGRTFMSSPQDAPSSSPPECNQSQTEPVETKKAKKKNRKAKKGKSTPEHERQLAWEAEFERRRTLALEKKLAEEDEKKRILEEESAARAEEQAELVKEQKRILKEQRKQDALLAKTESELAKLTLPRSAQWASSAESASRVAPVGLSTIQADQALEAEQDRTERFLAQQAIALSEAESKVAPRSRPNAWASVVGTDKISGRAETRSATLNPSSKVEFPGLRPSKAEPLRSPVARAPVSANPSVGLAAVKAPAVSVKPQPKDKQTSSVVSIWDLPSTGKNQSVQSKTKNVKKSKKKTTAQLNEMKSFAAKEQLAHWCESQLSSMPLSGVDLPTLVDLLCELEAADQVVEFIESSLGQSKLTSNFSKAFLEKRARILNTVP